MPLHAKTFVQLLIHGLVHCATAIDIWVEDDIDIRGFPRRAGTFQGRAYIAGLGHHFSVLPQSFHDQIVAVGYQLVGDIATLFTVFGQLPVADLIPASVVSNDAHKGQIKAHGRIDIKTGEAKRPITKEDKDFLLRQGRLGNNSKRCSNTDPKCLTQQE